MKPGFTLAARLTGVTLLYAAAAIGGLMYAVVGSTVTLVWAPSGIALAALLAYGYRLSFGIALGAFLANAWTGIPLAAAAVIAMGNTLEALVGAFLLVRLARFRNALDRRRDVFALIVLAAIFSTMLSASIGVATLALGGIVSLGNYATVWMKWWLGDMMGVLVVAPPLLVWLSRTRPALSTPKAVEALCLVAALVLVCHKIFGAPELAVHGYYPASLAVFPFIIWGALRFGPWGASLVTLVVSILAIWGTTRGTGPFVVDQPVDSLMRWCAFAIVVAVTGLLLAASVAEQRRAQAELKSSHDGLEQRVKERTQDIAEINTDLRREMAARRSLENALIRVSEEQQQAIGRELHDGLGQHLTGLALFSATLQHQLHERAQPEAEAAGRIVDLINQATAMTRAVARGLYPAALEVGGLPAALEQLAEHTRSLQGMTCVFRCDADLQVRDPLVAINLYRVAQEAVNNALKYSQASHLRIDLTRVEDRHRLCISDDGIGADPERIWRGQGLGMHNMRYRASLLGGTFAIEKNAHRGTTVAVIYPHQGEHHEQQRQHGA
ncbi:MASE1 domain-containing protein [Rhodoferax ferrireducens]|uniref:sensor histidine kinase n=1 Tax=Rhodoferax ferrireducens TaxID=192843 RepID=UPI000E0D4EC1|nr:MASE1 domain-containing protein [Rhodoferax ferrireducens]